VVKICRKCWKEIPLSLFGVDRRNRDGLQRMCKACRSTDTKRQREQSPDVHREALKRWRKKNPERAKFHRTKYFLAHREMYAARAKAWLKNHPEAKLAYTAAYRSRLAGAPGSHTPQDIRDLLKEQEGKCNGCGADIRESASLDHIVPISRGGGNGRDNIQLLCVPCNSKKHALDNAVFLARIRREVPAEKI